MGRLTLRQEGSVRTRSLRGSLGDSGSELRDSSQPQAGATAPGRPPWTIGLFNCANEKNNILFEEFGKDPQQSLCFAVMKGTGIMGTHSVSSGCQDRRR